MLSGAPAVVSETGEFLSVPAQVARDVPIVEWKLLEIYERRITRFGSASEKK